MYALARIWEGNSVPPPTANGEGRPAVPEKPPGTYTPPLYCILTGVANLFRVGSTMFRRAPEKVGLICGGAVGVAVVRLGCVLLPRAGVVGLALPHRCLSTWGRLPASRSLKSSCDGAPRLNVIYFLLSLGCQPWREAFRALTLRLAFFLDVELPFTLPVAFSTILKGRFPLPFFTTSGIAASKVGRARRTDRQAPARPPLVG